MKIIDIGKCIDNVDPLGIGRIRIIRYNEYVGQKEKSLDYEKYRLSFDPDQTNPSKIYINRCQNFKKNQPPKEWNGVYVLESK